MIGIRSNILPQNLLTGSFLLERIETQFLDKEPCLPSWSWRPCYPITGPAREAIHQNQGLGWILRSRMQRRYRQRRWYRQQRWHRQQWHGGDVATTVVILPAKWGPSAPSSDGPEYLWTFFTRRESLFYFQTRSWHVLPKSFFFSYVFFLNRQLNIWDRISVHSFIQH